MTEKVTAPTTSTESRSSTNAFENFWVGVLWAFLMNLSYVRVLLSPTAAIWNDVRSER